MHIILAVACARFDDPQHHVSQVPPLANTPPPPRTHAGGAVSRRRSEEAMSLSQHYSNRCAAARNIRNQCKPARIPTLRSPTSYFFSSPAHQPTL